MKYLCLVYQDEKQLDTLARGEYDTLVQDTLAYREELQRSGHYITSSPLQPETMATTLRVRHGKLAITDGPSTETGEQLGGFYLIDAIDLNEAIRVAALMPPARFGSVEVRPLMDLTAPEPNGSCAQR